MGATLDYRFVVNILSSAPQVSALDFDNIMLVAEGATFAASQTKSYSSADAIEADVELDAATKAYAKQLFVQTVNPGKIKICKSAGLDYAADLINRVFAGVEGVRTGIHVCRGNWSRNEEVLLSGDYTLLLPAFKKMQVDQFVLEYATPRAGEISVVGEALSAFEIGLGVVNPRTAAVEDPVDIIGQVKQALIFFRPEQIFLNPDCGFGCFANRCVNNEDTAVAKLRAMVRAARTLKESYA